jgi:peroxiredoxin
MSKRLLGWLVLPVTFAILSSALFVHADKTSAGSEKKLPAFTLTDPRDQKRVSASDFKSAKALVLVFVGTECPINNAYMLRLADLHKEYAAKGVQFLAVNSNLQDTPDRVAAHAKKHGLPFPVVKDAGNVLADQLEAKRTPEVFIFDAKGVVCYQGRIDDQFGVGFQRAKATRRDLAVALDELLAGKGVSQPTTSAPGCLIARAAKPKSAGTITYAKEVSRIMQNRCQECHRPEAIGPMALLKYEDAAAWSETIREVIEEKRMPPWHADPRIGTFANDRSLSPAERSTLLAWVDQGCPRGDDADLPPPREFVPGWRIGKPDLVLSMPEEFDVPAEAPKGGIPYQHIEVDPGFKEEMWIERAESRVGAGPVVHHIVVFVVPPGLKFIPKTGNAPVLCGTAPGDLPLILPEGYGKRIPVGSKFIFQMHYTPNGVAVKDRSSLGLVFCKKKPDYRVMTMPVANPAIRIPPGEPNYKLDSLPFTFTEDGHILSIMPHMHLRGKDFRVDVEYPDGKKETILSVPRFEFGWQSVYRFTEPRKIPKGSKIHCIAHFDNSAKNLNNPDPTKEVFWGDQTWEEMMIGWLEFHWDKKVN